MKEIALFSLLILCSLTAFAGSARHESCDLSVYGEKILAEGRLRQQSRGYFSTKLIVVTLDDEKTTLKTLMGATTNAGYPSTFKH